MAKRIFILGHPGPDAYALEHHVKDALRIAGIHRCTVRIMDDEEVLVNYGVSVFPALVIDETVRAIGRVPPVGELLNLLRLLGVYHPRDPNSPEGWLEPVDP